MTHLLERSWRDSAKRPLQERTASVDHLRDILAPLLRMLAGWRRGREATECVHIQRLHFKL